MHSKNNDHLLYNYKQTGGGTWGYFSHDNDYSVDLINKFGIETFKNRISKDSKLIMVKLFEDYEKHIENYENKDKIQNKNYIYPNNNYEHLGVVIFMLLRQFKISKKYLKKTLIMAYQNYIYVYKNREATGWKDYKQRLKALTDEIRIINFSVNYGSPLQVDKNIIKKGEIDMTKLCSFIKKNKLDIRDYIFLKHQKTKPEYTFMKYEVLPVLNPNLLQLGTVMKGYEGRGYDKFYIVIMQNGNKKWKRYDTYKDYSIGYLSEVFLYDIYGIGLNEIKNGRKIKITK